jgi:hypothetical protein
MAVMVSPDISGLVFLCSNPWGIQCLAVAQHVTHHGRGFGVNRADALWDSTGKTSANSTFRNFRGCHGFRGFGHSNAYHATGPTAYSLQRLTFKPESTIVENWQWLA